jgi:hypothetical protein
MEKIIFKNGSAIKSQLLVLYQVLFHPLQFLLEAMLENGANL